VTDRRDTFGAATIAALIALALAFGAQRGRQTAPATARAGDVTMLGGTVAKYTLRPASGRIEIETADSASRLEVEMSLIVDGVERPLVMRRSDLHLKDKNTLAAELPIEIGEDRAAGSFELRMDPASDLVSASLGVVQDKGMPAHSYALRMSLPLEGRNVFVPGVGQVGDVTSVDAKSVVLEDDVHPFGLVSTQGPLSIVEEPPDTDQAGARPRLVATAKTEGANAGKRLDLSIVAGTSSQHFWGRLYRVIHEPVARVAGVVTGTKERAHVIGLDEEGRPQVRAIVDAQGRFAIEAPTNALSWYASLEAVHTSAPVRFVPGTPWDLRLDVSAGGELHVRLFDAETKQPVIARLIVKGIAGTLDPSFGPDFRASGAGPLMDILEGEVTTPLPAGKYRVSATKGLEWNVESEELEITSGHTKSLDLAMHHVVATPGLVGCDLHVHARPSFDTPVTPEDRVLSLVSAGIDFAVPTEHNVTGDYTPAVGLLDVGKVFAHVNGVEVTTFNPRFGHFGVFPWSGTNVPPYRGTTAAAIITHARRVPERVVQVNHPRLPQGIGYFTIANFDPRSGRIPAGMRADFDTIEVYNGYEAGQRHLVERVMEDWYALLNLGKHIYATGSSDSHRIMYQWAGYPRTYALANDSGTMDTKEIVAAIKKGHSFVTSGPIVEFEAGPNKARPGDEVVVKAGTPLTAKLRVRAAPWVDVTAVDILAGIPPQAKDQVGTVVSVYKKSIPSTHDVVRFDESLSIDLPAGARWIIVIARGERPLDDVLPFMPIQPLGFTNPVWIAR